MAKERRSAEQARADREKRDQANAELGARVFSELVDSGKASRPDLVQKGEKLALKYNPMYCQHLTDRSIQGWSLNMVAVELLVHVNTLKNWAEAFPEFEQAYLFAKKARVAKFEHNHLKISEGESRGSAQLTSAYLAKHDPEEYADPTKMVIDIGKETRDGLDAIVAALASSPFSLATANPEDDDDDD